MAEKVARKMTVEEFFEWQQRQDRNYELVEGVPVPSHLPTAGQPYDAVRILRNFIASVPSVRDWQVDERLPSATSSKAEMTVCVVPPTGASFDFAKEVAELLLTERCTLLLLDAEQPRATLWSGKGEGRQTKEVVGLAEQIDLASIGVRLHLNGVYEGREFGHQA